MRSLFAAGAIATLLLSGDSAGDPARPTVERALPWLHGLSADAAADAPSRGAELGLLDARRPDPACVTSSTASFALVAELAPAPGLETVLASYLTGVVLLDANGRRLASAPPLVCSGSADAIVGVAAGAWLPGEPVIALAATAGGRAERTTWLFLLAPRGEALAPIFAAPVEEQRGEQAWVGEVERLPGGGLRYRFSGWRDQPLGIRPPGRPVRAARARAAGRRGPARPVGVARGPAAASALTAPRARPARSDRRGSPPCSRWCPAGDPARRSRASRSRSDPRRARARRGRCRPTAWRIR